MERLNTIVTMKQVQYIGINTYTMSINRDWVKRIERQHGTPKFIKVTVDWDGDYFKDRIIYCDFMFDGEMKAGYKTLTATGTDKKSLCFNVGVPVRTILATYPKVKKGKYVKNAMRVELINDLTCLKISRGDKPQFKPSESNKNISRKLSKITLYLEKVLRLPLQEILTHRSEINVKLCALKDYDPKIFSDLRLV